MNPDFIFGVVAFSGYCLWLAFGFARRWYRLRRFQRALLALVRPIQKMLDEQSQAPATPKPLPSAEPVAAFLPRADAPAAPKPRCKQLVCAALLVGGDLFPRSRRKFLEHTKKCEMCKEELDQQWNRHPDMCPRELDIPLYVNEWLHGQGLKDLCEHLLECESCHAVFENAEVARESFIAEWSPKFPSKS